MGYKIGFKSCVQIQRPPTRLTSTLTNAWQVMGSALTYHEVFGDEVALKVAAITKLTRNTLLAVAIPGFAWAYNPASKGHSPGVGSSGVGGLLHSVRKNVPLFVIGFVGSAVLRSLGDATLASSGDQSAMHGNGTQQAGSREPKEGCAFGFISRSQWVRITRIVGGDLPTYFLGTAMAAVGLSTSAHVFKGVGPRPFVAGLAASLVVGTAGAISAIVLGMFS